MIHAVEIINHVEDHMVMPITDPSTWTREFAKKIGEFDNIGYIIRNISGIVPGKAVINIPSYASLDGGVYASSRKDIRNIVISLIFDRAGSIESLRQRSYYWFPLRREITLIFYSDQRTLKIQGYVESNEISVFSKDEGAEISILCPDPMFIATDEDVNQSFSRDTKLFIPKFDATGSTESTVIHPGPVQIGYEDDPIFLETKSYIKVKDKPSRSIIFSNGRGTKLFSKLTEGDYYHAQVKYYINSKPAAQKTDYSTFQCSSGGNTVGLVTIQLNASGSTTQSSATITSTDYNYVELYIYDAYSEQVTFEPPGDTYKPQLFSPFSITNGSAVPIDYTEVRTYANRSGYYCVYKKGNAHAMSTRYIDPGFHFVYEGDAETGVKMTVSVNSGTPTGVFNVYNVYAEQLFQLDLGVVKKITGTAFHEGDQIRINTIPGHKNIQLVREGVYTNILNAMVRGSDWITMFKGDNYIRYITATGYDFLDFYFEYQARYEGV